MKQLTDEYQLVRQLGRGGMGEVWAGSRSGPNGMWMTCAIKLLHHELADTPRDLQMFLNEARIASQLDHSRIVKVFDVGTADDGRPFIVMEWVDGVNLRAFTTAAQKHGFWPLELDIVTYIVGEILAALEYAHDRTVGGMDAGVIHYDVTPGNIMISSSGEVKLTDFGISRFAANAGPLSRSIGTPRYMSPEQITGHPRRETDIYSLGVVLHELLDGRRYLEGYGQDKFQAQVLLGSAPELTRTDVPPWLDDLRRRMLANRAEQRPSARGVRTVLVDNCPRYMAAAEELKNRYYPRLIGRKRSGMTELLDVGAIEVAIRKQMLGASPKPIFSTTASTGTGQRDREQEIPTAVESSAVAGDDPLFVDHDPADVPAFTRRSGSQSPPQGAAETHLEPPPLADFDEASASEIVPHTRTSSRRDQLRLPPEVGAREPDLIEPTEELSPEDVRRALRLQADHSVQVAEGPHEFTQPLPPEFVEPTEEPDSSRESRVEEPTDRTVSGSVTLIDVPPEPAVSRPRRIPWSMAAALVAIVGLSVLSTVLLVKMSRTPEQPLAESVEPPPNPTVAAPDSRESVVSEPERPKVEPAEDAATARDTTPISITAPTVDPVVPTSDPVQAAERSEPTSKKQPKLAPKVGVRFVFDVDDGRVEIAGHTQAIKYGSTYIEVSSGKKHKMRFKPEGADWQTIGNLDAKGIAPKGYVVKFQKGKLSIEEVEGGTR